ncbi:MAG: M61 family metallopeptidase, partial [Bacteroidia bacterium]
DTSTVIVGNTKVLVSVYSPNGLIGSKFAANTLKELLYAQRDYLSGNLPVDKYAFLFYFTDKSTLSGASGALEHSYSSMYVLPEIDTLSIAQTLRDVSAHEFFHIVTPLNIHAEEIGNFDFNQPKMSEHLWLYEGLTEYAAHHAQVKAGLIGYDIFFQTMMEKYKNSLEQYNDTVPFTFMSRNVLTPHYHKQYNNVYEKGALIGMCLDIMCRYYSNGEYGTQDLMRDLAKTYGKNKSFKDKDLFGDIEKLTFPEVRKFLDECVGGPKPLPMVECFKMVGLELIRQRETESITLGGINIGFNDSTKRLVVIDVNNLDAFGKDMGYKMGDELYSFNNRLLTIENAQEVIGDFMGKTKVGDKLTVEVYRKEKKGQYKLKELSSKVRMVKVTEENIIDIIKDPTQKQITARRAWLGIK